MLCINYYIYKFTIHVKMIVSHFLTNHTLHKTTQSQYTLKMQQLCCSLICICTFHYSIISFFVPFLSSHKAIIIHLTPQITDHSPAPRPQLEGKNGANTNLLPHLRLPLQHHHPIPQQVILRLFVPLISPPSSLTVKMMQISVRGVHPKNEQFYMMIYE